VARIAAEDEDGVAADVAEAVVPDVEGKVFGAAFTSGGVLVLLRMPFRRLCVY